MLEDETADGLQLGVCVHVAGRVAGVADEDGAGPVGHLGGDVGHGWQGEAVLDARRDRHHLDARHGRKAVVVRVERLGNDDLVAWLEAGLEGKDEGLTAAGGHDDLFGRDVDANGCIVSGEPLPVGGKAVARAVFDDGAVHALDRIEGHLRGGDVGLADVEVEHLAAGGLGGDGERGEFADRAVGHGLPLGRNARHRIVWFPPERMAKIAAGKAGSRSHPGAASAD